MNYQKLLSQVKGVAGMNILLQVVVMIFVIGIVTMALALTGAQMKASTTDPDADAIIGNTTRAVGDVSDNFPLYITIAGVVVLILLIVVIIQALQGSGLMGGA